MRVTTSRSADEDSSSALSSNLRRNAIWAALLGVVAGAVVASIRASQLAPSTGPFEGSTSGAGTLLWILLAALPGAAIGLLGPSTPASAAARGLLIGLLWWAAWSLTIEPLVLLTRPTWSSAAVQRTFPDLVAAVLQGALTGLLWGVAARHVRSRRSAPVVHTASQRPRIVVIGGGFAGVAVAQRLERLNRRTPQWDVTLVSASNFLLFTPMLSEVAGGTLQAQHVGAALRAACPRTRFLLDRVGAIDLDARTVRLASGAVSFDHLVLALGAEPSFRNLPGVQEYCLTLKSLQDAAHIRDHVLTQLQLADSEADTEIRTELLTFAVAGGGYAGAELIAELRDLAHSTLRYFPGIDAADLRFVLIHSGARLLPELGPELADFAYQQLTARGLEIHLSTRVRGAEENLLLLEAGPDIKARTLVWTAGNQPGALIRSLPVEHIGNGAIVVDDELRVRRVDGQWAHGVWASGDCAAVPDGSGGLHPPTAQHALREGRQLADNLAAVIAGREPKPFRFRTIGMLAVLGHQTGVAEIRGRRFSGLLAWALWRVIYLSKLPGLEKRVRVALDWIVEIAFPRDIVLAQQAHTDPLPVTQSVDVGGKSS